MTTELPETLTKPEAGALLPPALVRRSHVLKAAWRAARRSLPTASRQLLYARDKTFAKWRNTGCPRKLALEVRNLTRKIMNDPLAKIAYQLQQKWMEEDLDEWRAINAPNDRAHPTAAKATVGGTENI